MPPRGKLLAIEGIDGSGKHTQVELLARALDQSGVDYLSLSFPRYPSFFGQAVAQYLKGEFGSLDQVDPHFAALLYAGDRLEAKGELESALASGRAVLADRYVASNLAHQGARVPAARRQEFLDWLRRLEYEIFGLPREDLVVYLRIPVGEATLRMGSRPRKLAQDIQESSQRHLEEAVAVYELLASSEEWAVIDCLDPETKQPRPADHIHREILALWKSQQSGTGRGPGSQFPEGKREDHDKG